MKRQLRNYKNKSTRSQKVSRSELSNLELRKKVKSIFRKLSEGINDYKTLKFYRPNPLAKGDDKLVAYVRVLDAGGWDDAIGRGEGKILDKLEATLKRHKLWYDMADENTLMIIKD